MTFAVLVNNGVVIMTPLFAKWLESGPLFQTNQGCFEGKNISKAVIVLT